MRTLWRLHIRPNGGDGDRAAAVDLCLRRNIIGMGWAVPSDDLTVSPDFSWYENAANEQYDADRRLSSVRLFANDVNLHDLVWFRDLRGCFYLAEVIGPWQYAHHDNKAERADIVNFRNVKIKKIGLADAVPGKIISCFRPSRTFQRIKDEGMLVFSEYLAKVDLSHRVFPDIFNLLSDVDLENLVFVYLQSLGWYVLPGTRSPTTAHYEIVLVCPKTGMKAIVQVKSGNETIDATLYKGDEPAYLFAASECYGNQIPKNVILITRHELEQFIKTHLEILPAAVTSWLGVLKSLTAPASISRAG